MTAGAGGSRLPPETSAAFLEVKSVQARAFFVSASERARAEEQRELFAFACVHRPLGEGDVDLLVDPHGHSVEAGETRLRAEWHIEKETDTRPVRY